MSFLQQNPPEMSKPSGGVAVAISLISLLVAVVMGLVSTGNLPKTAVWICVAGFVIVTGVFVSPYVMAGLRRYNTWRRQARVRRQFHESIIALCKSLVPLSEQSCVLSAGNILNSAMSLKVLGIASGNAYQLTISTLHDRIQDLLKFDSFISDEELMRLIFGWLQTYLRVCEGITNNIRESEKARSISDNDWEALARGWREIRDRASMLNGEYTNLAYQIREISQSSSIPNYLGAFPELVR